MSWIAVRELGYVTRFVGFGKKLDVDDLIKNL